MLPRLPVAIVKEKGGKILARCGPTAQLDKVPCYTHTVEEDRLGVYLPDYVI